LQHLRYFTVGIIHALQTFGSRRESRAKIVANAEKCFLTLHAVCLKWEFAGILFLGAASFFATLSERICFCGGLRFLRGIFGIVAAFCGANDGKNVVKLW
jgi:hypothetical protein